jgi:uncharacterized protein
VRAQPGAKRSGLIGVWNRQVKIALRAPPQDGRANEELLALLASALNLRARDLELAGGERSRTKHVKIPLPVATVRERLLAQLP